VFVFSLFPLSYRHFKILKIPIITILIIICLEIVLYSFGILKYSESLGDQEYGGITRISTTIGAATGTAVAVLLLLGIAYPLVNPKKEIVKNSILYFSGAAILITLSRGSIIAFMIILTIFLYKKYFQNKLKNIFKNIFKVAFSLIIAFLIGNNFGIFDSVLERSNSLNSNENLSSGRFDRWQSSFEFISESPIIGNGPNYYTILKRARHMDIDSLDLFSPHNTFFLILMQTGIIGFLVFLAILVTMCRQLRISNIGISGIVFYTTILISMNTEIVFVFMEFTGLFMLLWNISLIEKKQCLKTTE
jgi:O-antigen ligase